MVVGFFVSEIWVVCDFGEELIYFFSQKKFQKNHDQNKYHRCGACGM
jgi:hypothetical protein